MKKFPFFAVLCLSFAAVVSLTAVTACDFDETCNAEAAMVPVDLPGGGRIYIDMYEASRPDATAHSQGISSSRACSYRGTVPWGEVSYNEARNACLDAGKRLCTADEWIAACGVIYPYGTVYNPNACANGKIESDITGRNASCLSVSGTYDMSGNLSEWVEDGFLMGGSYMSEYHDQLMCTTAQRVSDIMYYKPTLANGFRCCADSSLQTF